MDKGTYNLTFPNRSYNIVIVERENFITRINYSPRLKGIFSVATFGTLGVLAGTLERSPDFRSAILKGHVADFFASPVQASLNKALGNRDDFLEHARAGLMINFSIETFQLFSFFPGTFDPKDYIAYTLGIGAWIIFDRSAKSLHDSGLTDPIYKALKIERRYT